MGNVDSVHLRFRVLVNNTLTSPVTVRRISLQSAGSSTMDIPISMNKFSRVIAGQARDAFDIWATARFSSPTTEPVRVPTALRVNIAFTNGSEKKEAVFIRQVNGRVGVRAWQ
ncbi:MAG TPA: hypothetical protein VNM92_14430 [Thermoanaerobaculia bacterium]|nr:hypothetical protein [Thermoanaerobaculia bacterium]